MDCAVEGVEWSLCCVWVTLTNFLCNLCNGSNAGIRCIESVTYIFIEIFQNICSVKVEVERCVILHNVISLVNIAENLNLFIGHKLRSA